MGSGKEVLSHKQIAAKVTAYVDIGIKELVELLNTFDNVWTFESCEGGHGEQAYICLYYGEKGKTSFSKVAYFAHKVARLLSERIEHARDLIPSEYEVTLSIEWRGDKKHPFILIEMPSDSIREITNIFYDVRREFCYDTCDKQR